MEGLNEPRSKVQESEDDVDQSRREGVLLLVHMKSCQRSRIVREEDQEEIKRKRGKESDEDEEIWSISNLVFGVAMDGRITFG